jgi:hypothetical protein
MNDILAGQNRESLSTSLKEADITSLGLSTMYMDKGLDTFYIYNFNIICSV